VLRTPRDRLRAELRRIKANPWIQTLAAGNPNTLRELAHAMKAYYDSAVRPHLPHIAKHIRADRVGRAETLLRAGTEKLLGTLHPALRWRAPVLELQGSFDRDLILGGRGLRLVPSYFCQDAPTVLADPRLPPVLVYPVSRTAQVASGEWAALAALLGSTRAQVLAFAAEGPTTTELGSRIDISPASASYHTSILREAGLIETTRDGTAVRHTLTMLGAELLERHPRLSSAS
jgi:DNA-binding transcriptional ArsR family regulator